MFSFFENEGHISKNNISIRSLKMKATFLKITSAENKMNLTDKGEITF